MVNSVEGIGRVSELSGEPRRRQPNLGLHVEPPAAAGWVCLPAQTRQSETFTSPDRPQIALRLDAEQRHTHSRRVK